MTTITITITVPEGSTVAVDTSGAPSSVPLASLEHADTGWKCPIHHAVKTVPAGTSTRTGKPYAAFQACPERGCDEKPPRV